MTIFRKFEGKYGFVTLDDKITYVRALDMIKYLSQYMPTYDIMCFMSNTDYVCHNVLKDTFSILKIENKTNSLNQIHYSTSKLSKEYNNQSNYWVSKINNTIVPDNVIAMFVNTDEYELEELLKERSITSLSTCETATTLELKDLVSYTMVTFHRSFEKDRNIRSTRVVSFSDFLSRWDDRVLNIESGLLFDIAIKTAGQIFKDI